MPGLHLKQLGFIYKACGPFTKHRERIKNFRETSNLKHLYRNELDKACSDNEAAYSDSKLRELRELFQIRFWKIELMKIARNHNYDGYQKALAHMIYKFFDKKRGSGITVN